MNWSSERVARLLILVVIAGLFTVIALSRWLSRKDVIEVHASMPENGGWSLDGLSVEAGQPLHLRLVSDDVLHGFAIGRDDRYNLDLKPGQPVEISPVFEVPGKYTFYCTRWCGPNHWRMRGTIDVSGPVAGQEDPGPPLYIALGLDLDAEHITETIPQTTPSAARGRSFGADIPAPYFSLDYYQAHSPASAFQELRSEPGLESLDDEMIWDLVAYLWSVQAPPEVLAEGEQLYSANCAACHGESGAGDGVMAAGLAQPDSMGGQDHPEGDHDGQIDGHETNAPTDFTDARHILAASPALLHGKIVRGGMGTGMPYWGPIFTDEQIWSLVSYLWTFQFQF